MSAFSLPIPPGALTGRPSQAYGTLRYHSFESAASVHGFSPDTYSAQDCLFLPVRYYALFKDWRVLSQPAGSFGLASLIIYLLWIRLRLCRAVLLHIRHSPIYT